MRKLLLSALVLVSALDSKQSLAQMVGDCVFLKGKYVEVGVAPNGGYGTPLPAPSTYNPFLTAAITFYDPGAGTMTTSNRLLGFVADYGRDGWGVGSPVYYGDYYLPGTPQEGWAIRVGASESEAYIPSYWTSGTTGFTGTLAGTNLSYSNSANISRGVWRGTAEGGALEIRQTTILDTNKLYFTVNVVLKNTTTSPLTGIYYLRTLDPDNEQTRSTSFTTSNTITYQLPNPGNKVLVSAVGTSSSFSTNAYLGLGTKDCRAKCMIFNSGLEPAYTLNTLWAGTGTPYYYTLGYNYVNDVGVGLVYNIGTLAGGDSTSLTYAYILNAAYIDSALDATQPPFLVNSYSFNSGDTINLCTYNFDTAVISMGSGSFYNWHWSPGTYLTDTTATSNVVDVDLVVGSITYTITGVNTAGACDTVVNYLTLTHDTFSIALYNNDTAVCLGSSVNASVVGPPLLTYRWTPVSGVSNPNIMNPVFTPSVTTTYTVTASSSAGCPPVSRSFTIGVLQPPVLTLDSSLVNTCTGIPVNLNVYVAPGGVAYDYSWTPPAGLSSTTIYNPIVTPTSTGDFTYVVTVNPTAVPGCRSRDTIVVHVVPDDFILNNRDTPICLGNFVQASITGSSEFTYTWTPSFGVSNTSIPNPTLTPTTSTTYVATATYARCPDMVHSFNIEVDTPAHYMSFIDTICLGMSTTFDVDVPGPDTGSNYYHYQWLPTTGVSNDTIPNPIITPPAVGTYVYNVEVRPHAEDCEVVDLVTIEVLPNTISVRPTDTAICKGQYVQVIGVGHPAFSYQWLPTAGIAISDVLNARITPDTTDEYMVTASFHRCPDMTATLRLDVQPNPTVYIGGNRFLCEFDTLHVNSFVSPSWYGAYIYSWTPGTDLDYTNTPNVVFSGSTTTELHLDVSTSAGCKSNDSAVVTVIPGNFASMIADAEFCPGDTLQLVPTAVVAGVTYHWSPPYYLSDSAGSAPVIRPITSQVYTVVATTINGCRDTMIFSTTVHQAGVLSITDSARIFPGESYHIQPMTNCVSISWFPPAGLDNATIADPVATPVISTRYIATGLTEFNCIVRDTIDVFVSGESEIAMPNAFTPGTGVNNTYKVMVAGIAQLNHFRIFNRWGNVMFETKNISEGWDGTFNGKPQPFGVYIYEIEGITNTGTKFLKKGNLTLLR